MSFYEDFVANGLCCSTCGQVVDGKETDDVRLCAECTAKLKKRPTRKSKTRSYPHHRSRK